MRTQLAVKQQLAAVEKFMRKWRPTHGTHDDDFDSGHLGGMQQALAWVLELDAASPRQCLPRKAKVRR